MKERRYKNSFDKMYFTYAQLQKRREKQKKIIIISVYSISLLVLIIGLLLVNK